MSSAQQLYVTRGCHMGQHNPRELRGLKTDCSLVLPITGDDLLTMVTSTWTSEKGDHHWHDSLSGWNHWSAWESGKREGYYEVRREEIQEWIPREQFIILSLVWFVESSNHHHDLSAYSSLSLSPLPFPWLLAAGSFWFLKICAAHQGDFPNNESITWPSLCFFYKVKHCNTMHMNAIIKKEKIP